MLDLTLTKTLDAITLGRAGLGLYAAQDNTEFNQVSAFNKHVGGSPANIAVGMAKLGARVGIVSRLSDDVVGRYVEHYLQSQNVNTDGVGLDATGTRTSLAITEMRPDNCNVVIYRNNAADLALSAEHLDANYIQSARMLIVSGTALSAEPSRGAVFAAIDIAVAHNVMVVLDLDYRAYTWVSLQEAADIYQKAAQSSHLVLGNSEEFEVLGASKGASPESIAQLCLQGDVKAIFVKAGELGSRIFCADGRSFEQPIFAVQTRKPFGAGDAYCAAICSGLAEGRPLEECVKRGAAAAAIVVAGDSCGDASPTAKELDAFLSTQA